MPITQELLDLAGLLDRFGPTRSKLILRRQFVRAKTIQAAGLRALIRNETGAINGLTGSKLKSRLLATMFHLDFSNYRFRVRRVHYELSKAQCLVNILVPFGATRAGLALARKRLPLALKYERTAVAIDLLSYMRTAAAIRGDVRRFDAHDAMLTTLANRQRAEILAGGYYRKLLLLFASSGSDHPELALQTIEHAEVAEREFLKYDSYLLGLTYYRLLTAGLQMSRRFEAVLEACSKAIDFLDSRPVLAQSADRSNFELLAAIAEIHLRKYDSALERLEQSISRFEVGHAHWFVLNESIVYSLMHLERFKEAKKRIELVMNTPRFSRMPELNQERWRLFELHVQFALGELRASLLTKKRLKQVRYFFRSSPAYRGDKVGYNLSVLILHVLYLIEEGDINSAIDRVTAINVYRKRYVRHSQHPQTYMLLSHLSMLAKVGFDAKKLDPKHTKALEESFGSPTWDQKLEGFQPLSYEWIVRRLRKPAMRKLTKR